MELTHQQHTVKTSARHNIYTSHINKYTTTVTVYTLTSSVHRVQVTTGTLKCVLCREVYYVPILEGPLSEVLLYMCIIDGVITIFVCLHNICAEQLLPGV